ncbi:hypothetical protein XELAEV_18002160mg [Xenopus laevis]|uniref:Uncharacterized protein n=1 Tax=Xenopus laevis TaxID=8355 RepID=A0A974GYE4_XENLA|nr:hypothetical protein XELAEV_18002160mg [Xenopus laevis]
MLCHCLVAQDGIEWDAPRDVTNHLLSLVDAKFEGDSPRKLVSIVIAVDICCVGATFHKQVLVLRHVMELDRHQWLRVVSL